MPYRIRHTAVHSKGIHPAGWQNSQLYGKNINARKKLGMLLPIKDAVTTA